MLDDGEPRVGMRWQDVTWPGPRPLLLITELAPDRRWVEVGRWRGIEAELALDFAARPGGTDVTATVSLTGHGPWLLPAYAARVLAGPAVAADLRRAARLLGR